MLPEENARPAASPAAPNPAGKVALPVEAEEPLSPEEQLARYEEALKESDWGHQPC